MGVLLLLGQGAVTAQLDAWQLLPRPERFTQLYFATGARPVRPIAVEEKQEVAFVVQNDEHQRTTYHYKIVASAQEGKLIQQLAQDSFTLEHGSSELVDRIVTIPQLSARLVIRVELQFMSTTQGQPDPHMRTQSIHYWLGATGRLPSLMRQHIYG